jgi:H(+)-translocating pyrophosphatase
MSTLAAAWAAYVFSRVVQYPTGSVTMQSIARLIEVGSKAFMHKEYGALGGFCVAMFAVLCAALYQEDEQLLGVYTGVCFVTGASLSALSGYVGMRVSTLANVRTCQASKRGVGSGLNVAFESGSVMGFTVVSSCLFGLSILFLIFDDHWYDYVPGFGFGASAVALFARVGGGIYTKAADVGADLVGKVEAGITEDSANNPATIADNVGDNVGDVAGMGADLFESYAGSILSACILSRTFIDPGARQAAAAFPLWVSGFGILASIVGTRFVHTSDIDPRSNTLDHLLWIMRKGTFVASGLSVVFAFVSCYVLFGSSTTPLAGGGEASWWRVFLCACVGLVVGNVIGMFTEYCTAYQFHPTQSIARAAVTGPATVIIQGLGVGMLSVGIPVASIVVGVVASSKLTGIYGVAVSAVGMLSTLGITLATDAYGPVADNAGGIAEMDEACGDNVRETTDALDALGNTTAATGKGFAIGSAVLTASALIASYMRAVDVEHADLTNPIVISGVLCGSALPFLFAALTMLSVQRSASAIIVEVRRQFAAKPWLKTDTTIPFDEDRQADYTTCVTIATESSIREMALPGVIAISSPIVLGFLLGPAGLAGVLVGSLASGAMLSITMANAGGAWDNAKKWTEKGYLVVDGVTVTKGSDEHAAVVIGDTVGDPFKDTSGPALNVLVKLMALVSLVIAPRLRSLYDTDDIRERGFDGYGVLVSVVVCAFCISGLWAGQRICNGVGG